MGETVFLPEQPVLDRAGRPLAGYSIGSAAVFDPKAVKAPPFRFKAWDFYQIYNGRLCAQLTIGHVSYMGQIALALFNAKSGERIAEKSLMLPLALGFPRMPADASEDAEMSYRGHGVSASFATAGRVRKLSMDFGDVSAEFTLTVPDAPCSVAVMTPFPASPHAFYYNHKWNCLAAGGHVTVSGTNYAFEAPEAMGLLDWGRGVLPFRHSWLWSSGSGMRNGKPFGFNLGAFGDNTHGSENVVYANGGVEKLGLVTIAHDADWMRPWRMRDDAGKLDLVLTPQYDHDSATKLLFVDNRCHQVFGRVSGTLRMSGGETLAFDRLPAFAEHAVNRW